MLYQLSYASAPLDSVRELVRGSRIRRNRQRADVHQHRALLCIAQDAAPRRHVPLAVADHLEQLIVGPSVHVGAVGVIARLGIETRCTRSITLAARAVTE